MLFAAIQGRSACASNRESLAQFEKSNQASGVRKAQYGWKGSILLAGTGVRKISSVTCGFSLIKIHFSDYPKNLISRITHKHEC